MCQDALLTRENMKKGNDLDPLFAPFVIKRKQMITCSLIAPFLEGSRECWAKP
jgi:hypothetical protein